MSSATPDHLLHEWLRRSPGRLLARMETRLIAAELGALHGRQLVQIGDVLPPALFAHCGRFQHRWVLGRTTGGGKRLIGSAACLPLQSDSVDVLLLPHALELTDQSHDVIREAHRVLVPEGHLIVSGFNPWSLAGIARLLLPRRRTPWSGTWLGAGRVRDWLALLGFQAVTARRGWLQRAGRLWDGEDGEDGGVNLLGGQPPGAFFGGVYVLVARKKVIWLRPVVSRWRVRPTLSPVGLAEPSARASGD